jgi:hypothetical protein
MLVLAGCGGGSAATHRTNTLPPQPSTAYKASLAYATCLRAHGLDHPNPDANGDFHLTPVQEERLKASAPRGERQQADKDCFRFLKGAVSTKPLSKAAIRAALAPLRELKECLHGFGYDVGKPTVKNLSRGRAFFGFEGTGAPGPTKTERPRLQQAQHTCEKRVHLARRVDEIVKIDRGEGR